MGCQNTDEHRQLLKEIQQENRLLEWKIKELKSLNAKSEKLIETIDKKSANLSLSSLSIVDDEGNERIKLFIDPDDVTRIKMYRNNGEATNSISSTPIDSKYKGFSGFSTFDSREKPAATIGHVPNQLNYVGVFGKNGELRSYNSFSYITEISAVKVLAANRKSHAEIAGLPDGATVNRLIGPDNKVRIANLVTPDHKSYQLHLNSAGEVLQGVYVSTDKKEFRNYSYRKPAQRLWDVFSNVMTVWSARRK